MIKGDQDPGKLNEIARSGLTLIEPLHRQGRMSFPSCGSASAPSRHMRHCFSSAAGEEGWILALVSSLSIGVGILVAAYL